MVNWRPCCVLQLKHIVDSNNFPVCSKRLSTIEHSASHGAALCNLCARESGNQPVETLPLPFNLNQTQESVRISSLNALLDVTLQFIVSPDSNLIGIGEYVKEQFGKLLHHKGNVALTPAELDCMLNSILHLYGSSVTGLQVSCVESDIDLMIEPPGTVRVPKSSTRAESEDSDAEESEEKDSESESEEENEEEEEENGEDESNLDTAQKEKRIKINLIANREMREILSLLISKEEKARKNPKAQRSDQYLEFLTQGRALIEEAESLLKEQIKSLKLAAAKEAADAAAAKKAAEQSLLEASNGTTEDHLPEVNLLKVVEKLIRRYGSQYGFTLTAYLHHIRVPLLSVRVALPRTLPSLQKQTESSDLSTVEAGAREGEGKLPPWISCDITLFKYHPLRNTAFICAYLNWDQSNKLKALMLLVKRFVQVNGIHGASHGFLSSYTWVMLVIHCLLRLEMIPPLHLLHHPTRDREKEREREGVHSETTEGAGAGANGEERSALREENSSQFGFSLESNPAAPATAPAPLVTLSESSVTELFKFFLFYYTTQIDLISDVITLRGHGEV
jgi:chemotaxis protein histidine kinase CheA